MKKQIIFGLLFLILLMACSDTKRATEGQTVVVEKPSYVFDLPLRKDLGEYELDDEKNILEGNRQVLRDFMERVYKDKKRALRDFHTKAHGCVRARFHVLKDVPPGLAQGIFRPNKTYDAWLRFSNGDSKVGSDLESGSRGIGIKILKVAGEKLLRDRAQTTTQDFLMINRPYFFIKDADENLAAIKARDGGLFGMAKFALLHPLAAYEANKNNQIDNPLNTQYWSMTPYQHGDLRLPVKYTVKPCKPEEVRIPRNAETNYLRSVMKKKLENEGACFVFAIQVRPKGDEWDSYYPTEHARQEWKTRYAPFINVALIDIEKGNFDTPAQNEYCENLAFTPWQGLKEHRPLGSLNRARKVVYETIAEWRRAHNVVPQAEPNEMVRF